MAAMRDVWGNKIREKNAPRCMSKKKLRRVNAAWARVMNLLVEQGAAGDCPCLLLLAERKCEQLEQQLKETQVQAEKEAKKELEAEKRAHRRTVNVLKKQYIDKVKRRESNHYRDMKQLQMELDLLQDSLKLKEQDSWRLAEKEDSDEQQELEIETLETYGPCSMDGEAAGAMGAVVIDASDDESTDMDESEALTVE